MSLVFPSVSNSSTGGNGWGTTSNLDLDTLQEMVDFVLANKAEIVQAVKGQTFKFDLASLPNVLKGNILRYYNTASVFSSNFNLAHNGAPFSGGVGFTSTTSTVDSPLGEKYEIYTVDDANNSYAMHLDSGTTGFLPVSGKKYQYGMVCRGVGTSIGKSIVSGFYKPARVNTKITLSSEWSLALTDPVVNDSTDFNLYTHGNGITDANLALGEKFEIAMFFVLQVD